MSIRMIGIDHNKACLDERALFSFTVKSRGESMEKIAGMEGIYGCVILSTCNRMELWVSTAEDYEDSLYPLLCHVKEIKGEEYRRLFVERRGEEAVRHLFSLTSGMKSLILGEDQILTQVKEALSLAREHFATDQVLEVLFRMCVTAAKKTKTEVHLSMANASAIEQAVEQLKSKGYTFAGRKCLVIGNGEMGKLAALILKKEGAEVTVTVRQFRSGIVSIPEGCERIGYGDRIEYLKECSFIVSATASPNLTLEYQDVASLGPNGERVFIDLAVPRDIDPKLANLPGVTLYDIDYFHIDPQSAKLKIQLMQIELLLEEQIEAFLSWYECRDVIPMVGELSLSAGEDVKLRMHKIIRQIHLPEEEEAVLEASISSAAEKVVKKLMFEIRDSLGMEMFRACTETLNSLYKEEGVRSK